jgi:hypothetical protein
LRLMVSLPALIFMHAYIYGNRGHHTWACGRIMMLLVVDVYMQRTAIAS